MQIEEYNNWSQNWQEQYCDVYLTVLGNIRKWCPIFWGHFWPTIPSNVQFFWSHFSPPSPLISDIVNVRSHTVFRVLQDLLILYLSIKQKYLSLRKTPSLPSYRAAKARRKRTKANKDPIYHMIALLVLSLYAVSFQIASTSTCATCWFYKGHQQKFYNQSS